MKLKEALEKCTTLKEVNSYRVLLVTTERETFSANQKKFKKMLNKLARVPRNQRCSDFGEKYMPETEQAKEVTDE